MDGGRILTAFYLLSNLRTVQLGRTWQIITVHLRPFLIIRTGIALLQAPRPREKTSRNNEGNIDQSFLESQQTPLRSVTTLPTLRSGIKLRLTASLSHADYLRTSLGLNGPSASFTDNIAHPPPWQPDSALPRALRETSVAATMR